MMIRIIILMIGRVIAKTMVKIGIDLLLLDGKQSMHVVEEVKNELPIMFIPAIEVVCLSEFVRLVTMFWMFEELVTEMLPVITTEPDSTDNILI